MNAEEGQGLRTGVDSATWRPLRMGSGVVAALVLRRRSKAGPTSVGDCRPCSASGPYQDRVDLVGEEASDLIKQGFLYRAPSAPNTCVAPITCTHADKDMRYPLEKALGLTQPLGHITWSPAHSSSRRLLEWPDIAKACQQHRFHIAQASAACWAAAPWQS